SAGYLNTRWSTADNAEGQRSVVYKSRIFVNCFKGLEDVLLEPKRIIHCVKRERMLVRTRRVKEVHYCPQSQNQVIVMEWVNTFRHNFLLGQIDAADHGLMESNVFSAVQQLPDGKTDFPGRQFVSRHLVKQRLKGVIVVLVDYRDFDIGVG